MSDNEDELYEDEYELQDESGDNEEKTEQTLFAINLVNGKVILGSISEINNSAVTVENPVLVEEVVMKDGSSVYSFHPYNSMTVADEMAIPYHAVECYPTEVVGYMYELYIKAVLELQVISFRKSVEMSRENLSQAEIDEETKEFYQFMVDFEKELLDKFDMQDFEMEYNLSDKSDKRTLH